MTILARKRLQFSVGLVILGASHGEWAAATEEKTLAPVVVYADGNEYVPTDVSSATRTNTPLAHVPQSVVTVTRDLIEDQQVNTLSDALRNVSNVSAIDPRDANNRTFLVRGFTSSTVIDGVTMPGYFPALENLANVERVDVIKGPAGNLFGSGQAMGGFGALGGTVAITTVAPEAQARQAFSVRAGSYGERGTSIDVNQPLGKALSARIVAEASDSDSETDDVYFKRRAIFPSVALNFSDADEVILRMRYLDNATPDYSGLPVNGTLENGSYQLPDELFITAEGLPETTTFSKGANLQWKHRFDSVWSVNLVGGYNEAEVDQRGVWPAKDDAMTNPFACLSFGQGGPLHSICGARLWDAWTSKTLSPSVTAKWQMGSVSHTVNAGVDIEKTTDDAFLTYSNALGPLSLLPADARNYIAPLWVEPASPAIPDQRNEYFSRTYYLQNQVDLRQWHLLAGLRQSAITVDDINPSYGIENHSSNSDTTPRVGVVYDVVTGFSVFTGYSAGIKVPIGSIFAEPPKPEEYEQNEVGVRLTDYSNVSATLAWFDLTRTNSAVGDTNNPGFSVQTGEQQARGVDLDMSWQATKAWVWLLAMTHQDASITDDSNDALEGSQLFNVADRMARLATRYEFSEGALAGWGAGGGVTYTSALPLDSVNSRFVPSSTVWDAQISYSLEQLTAGLAIRNLFDREYYVPSTYFGGGQVIPAAGRTLSATATYAF